ncbi:hypothetical protein tb265_27440 [Gemmatimonadetes bacterium T265]|nr:hypothetical protein tb265_27440 [Gemmatimonadetes bacterium T265]
MTDGGKGSGRIRCRSHGSALTAAWLASANACAPHAAPLPGAPTPRSVSLPRVELPPAARRVTFNWSYDEQDGASARGEGVARVSPPDTAQLQFFLAGGFAAGAARLTGNRLEIPNREMFRRLIPDAPLLWAALGRLALPPAPDTTLRQSGDTLRGDVGRAPTWRVTLVRDTLRRVERIDNGRVTERLDRAANRVTYRHEVERRSLRIDVVRDVPIAAQ